MQTDKQPKTSPAGRAEETRAGRIRTVFHNQDSPGGSDDVFVSVNGKAYLIKREHEVLLPPEVVHVVENAEQTVFERDGEGTLRERRVKRYAFTVRE